MRHGIGMMLAIAPAAMAMAACSTGESEGLDLAASPESAYFQGDASGLERYRESATILDDLDALSAEAPTVRSGPRRTR